MLFYFGRKLFSDSNARERRAHGQARAGDARVASAAAVGGGARVLQERASSARGLLLRASEAAGPRSGRPKEAGPPLSFVAGFFSFLYLKKIKISKIYGRFEKFQNYTPVAQT